MESAALERGQIERRGRAVGVREAAAIGRVVGAQYGRAVDPIVRREQGIGDVGCAADQRGDVALVGKPGREGVGGLSGIAEGLAGPNGLGDGFASCGASDLSGRLRLDQGHRAEAGLRGRLRLAAAAGGERQGFGGMALRRRRR